MINLKTQLEESTMKKVQEIISKAIEEKHELEILEDVETNLENFVINEDEFDDYLELIRDLLGWSEAFLSNRDVDKVLIRNNIEKLSYTEEDFLYYITLIGQIWKVLDENVSDKDYVRDVYWRIVDDFDDLMSNFRGKVVELKFDKTDVWKELEKKIEKFCFAEKYDDALNQESQEKFQEKKSRKSVKNWIIFLMVIGIIAFLVSGQGPEEFPEFLIISIVVVVIAVTIMRVGKHIIEFYSMRH